MEKSKVKDFYTDEEVAAIETPDFISDKEMAALDKKKEVENYFPETTGSNMEQVQTVAEQAANTIGMGYLPQVVGGVRSAMSDEDYLTERDKYIREMESRAAENPISAMAGVGTGIAGSMALPAAGVLKLAKGLPLAARTVMAGAAGLGNFLAQNPGDVEGVIDPIQAQDRLQMVEDSPILAGISTVAPMAGPIAKKAKLIDDPAAAMAYKALNTKMDETKKALSRGEDFTRSIKNVGRDLLDKGIISGSEHKMLERSQGNLEKVGKQIGNMVDVLEEQKDLQKGITKKLKAEGVDFPKNKVDKGLRIGMKSLDEVGDMLAEEMGAVMTNHPEKKVVRFVQNWINTNGNGKKYLGFNDMQKLRTDLQSKINWADTRSAQTEVNDALKKMVGLVDKSSDDYVNFLEKKYYGNSSFKERLTHLKNLRKEYSIAKTINDSILNKAAKKVKAPMSKLTLPAVGATVGALAGSSNIVGGVIGGLAGAGLVAANKMVKPENASRILNILQQVPESRLFSGGSQNMATAARMQREKTIEGYPEFQTQAVNEGDKLIIEQAINGDPSLNVVERAKQLRLLRKYNRMVIEPQSY